jgi:hypothetical protein
MTSTVGTSRRDSMAAAPAGPGSGSGRVPPAASARRRWKISSAGRSPSRSLSQVAFSTKRMTRAPWIAARSASSWMTAPPSKPGGDSTSSTLVALDAASEPGAMPVSVRSPAANTGSRRGKTTPCRRRAKASGSSSGVWRPTAWPKRSSTSAAVRGRFCGCGCSSSVTSWLSAFGQSGCVSGGAGLPRRASRRSCSSLPGHGRRPSMTSYKIRPNA